MRTTHNLVNIKPGRNRPLPGMGALRRGAAASDLELVQQVLEGRGGPKVLDNFVQTAQPHQRPQAIPGFKAPKQRGIMPSEHIRNPQTVSMLQMLQLPYNLDHKEEKERRALQSMQGPHTSFLPQPPPHLVTAAQIAAALDNPEEINLDDDGYEELTGGKEKHETGADEDEKDFLNKDPMFQPL
jgi:hypothetical protein